jgi:Uma2 family endonuclease
MAATPYWPHPEVIDNLDDILGSWVRSHRLGRVLGATTGLYLNPINYLDPDLVYIRQADLPRRRRTRHKRAALAVEVLSPSNLRASPEEREARLLQLGVEEVWYVDYDSRCLEVRRLGPGGYQTAVVFRGDDAVSTPILPGLEFPLTAAWEDLEEDPDDAPEEHAEE